MRSTPLTMPGLPDALERVLSIEDNARSCIVVQTIRNLHREAA